MLCAPMSRFLADQRGGGTIMGLLWFMLLVGITGMAVDTTNGFRNRTMLQATADAAALAAAIDLPDQAAVVTTAVTYAAENMGAEINGSVLDPADVRIGLWDGATRSLDIGAALPDSVMVTVRRSEANNNPVPVNFLRIVGLTNWNVQARAVAQRFIPECLKDGLVARGIVDISSNNGFANSMCVHGQQGVQMQNHNSYQSGVTVSMPDPSSQLVIPAAGMTSNPGLPGALRENILDPRMVNHIGEILVDLLNPASPIIPAYIDTSQPVIVVDSNFNFNTYLQGRIYHVVCNPNKQLKVPANASLTNVVIISDCNISVGAKAYLSNVVLGSTALGNGVNPLAKANISFSANVDLGVADNCAPGGGVQIFSAASVHFSSSMTMDGVQIVAGGDVELGARGQGVNGISVQAGQDISLTSNNMFGLCSGGAPDLFTVDYYRLVL